MSKNKLAIPRLTHFVAMLKENRYPNHPTLVQEMRMLDIAGAYSVSQKTLQRDVAFLRSDYDAPIAYDYQHRGYYLTDPNWTWDIPQLSESDMDTAIIATHLADSIMPSPFGKRAKKTLDALIAGSETISNKTKMLVRLVACNAGIPVKPEIFLAVFDGWVSRRVLRINYTRAMDGETSKLTIEPQILAFYEGCWYLRVKLRHSSNPLFADKHVITIALHRIKNVIPTAIQFDISEQMINDANAQRIFDFPLLENVKLSLSGKGLRFAMEQFHLKVESRTPDGKIVAYVSRVPQYKINNLVFAWPGDVCVLEPKSLRKSISQSAKRVSQIHQSGLNAKSDSKERKVKK